MSGPCNSRAFDSVLLLLWAYLIYIRYCISLNLSSFRFFITLVFLLIILGNLFCFSFGFFFVSFLVSSYGWSEKYCRVPVHCFFFCFLFFLLNFLLFIFITVFPRCQFHCMSSYLRKHSSKSLAKSYFMHLDLSRKIGGRFCQYIVGMTSKP